MHQAQDVASKRGKLLTDDFLFLIRKVLFRKPVIMCSYVLSYYLCFLKNGYSMDIEVASRVGFESSAV